MILNSKVAIIIIKISDGQEIDLNSCIANYTSHTAVFFDSKKNNVVVAASRQVGFPWLTKDIRKEKETHCSGNGKVVWNSRSFYLSQSYILELEK